VHVEREVVALVCGDDNFAIGKLFDVDVGELVVGLDRRGREGRNRDRRTLTGDFALVLRVRDQGLTVDKALAVGDLDFRSPELRDELGDSHELPLSVS
jgi:hypothetical protein